MVTHIFHSIMRTIKMAEYAWKQDLVSIVGVEGVYQDGDDQRYYIVIAKRNPALQSKIYAFESKFLENKNANFHVIYRNGTKFDFSKLRKVESVVV